MPYTTFIPRLSGIGFTAIAISVIPEYPIGGRRVANAAALDQLSPSDRKSIKQAFQERDLALPSVIGNQSIVQENADQQMARLKASIDLCVDLNVNGELPTLNTGTGGKVGDLDDPGLRQRMLDRLGELADYAADRGVTVCIEPHVGAPINTVDNAEWLIRTINKPSLRLDFDVSHFEVVGVPTDQSVNRLVPLAAAAEIKDQHYRVLTADAPESDSWYLPGNGTGRASTADGREVEYQFLLAGEGTFDLPAYLRLMRAQGFNAPIAFEVSVQCQARPNYDALTAAAGIYRWMAEGWAAAGMPTD